MFIKKEHTIITFFLLAYLIFFSCIDKNTRNQKDVDYKYSLCPKEYSKIREGDIIMRQGFGIVSSVILKTLNENIPLSHIGVIIKDNNDKYHVVHSVSNTISDYDGIQIDELNEFVSQSRENSIIVSRYIKHSSSGKKIDKQAKYYLNKKIPFDHLFNFEDSTAFFCSELIWRILLDLFDDDIFDHCPDNLLIDRFKFKSFYCPKSFEVIINHHDTII